MSAGRPVVLCVCGHSERDHQGWRAKCWNWIHGYRAGVICTCVGWKPVKP